MYLLCSDWSIRSLEEKEKEEKEENCHLLITAVVPTKGRDKNHCNAVEGSAYTGLSRGCVDFCVIRTNIAVYRGRLRTA